MSDGCLRVVRSACRNSHRVISLASSLNNTCDGPVQPGIHLKLLFVVLYTEQVINFGFSLRSASLSIFFSGHGLKAVAIYPEFVRAEKQEPKFKSFGVYTAVQFQKALMLRFLSTDLNVASTLHLITPYTEALLAERPREWEATLSLKNYSLDGGGRYEEDYLNNLRGIGGNIF